MAPEEHSCASKPVDYMYETGVRIEWVVLNMYWGFFGKFWTEMTTGRKMFYLYGKGLQCEFVAGTLKTHAIQGHLVTPFGLLCGPTDRVSVCHSSDNDGLWIEEW